MKTLKERAVEWSNKSVPVKPDEAWACKAMVYRCFLQTGWLAGYRAGKRDAAKEPK